MSVNDYLSIAVSSIVILFLLFYGLSHILTKILPRFQQIAKVSKYCKDTDWERIHRRIATHETGHALIALSLGKKCKQLQIDPLTFKKIFDGDGLGAGSCTTIFDKGSQEEIIDIATYVLGGYVLEFVLNGYIGRDTGDDLKDLTTDLIRYLQIEEIKRSLQGSETSKPKALLYYSKDCSDETKTIVEEGISQKIAELLNRVKYIICDNRDIAEEMISHLLKHGKIEGKELEGFAQKIHKFDEDEYEATKTAEA